MAHGLRIARPIMDRDELANALTLAAQLAIGEAELQRCVGESGRIQLAVELKLNGGHVVNTEAGVGFRRRLF